MTKEEALEFIKEDVKKFGDDDFTKYIAEKGWQRWYDAYVRPYELTKEVLESLERVAYTFFETVKEMGA